MIREMWAYLRRPDAYPDDWYRWMGGQAGHAAIIGGPLALAQIALGGPVAMAGTLAGFVYWLVWETLIQRGRDWRDNLDDATHVALGASLVSMPFAFIPAPERLEAAMGMGAVYLIWLVLLTVGIHRRLKGRADG